MKLSNTRWLSLFLIAIFLSCQQEHGNFTAVNQEAMYIYGVWKAPTAKIAKQALASVSERIAETAKRNDPSQTAMDTLLPVITISEPITLLPKAVQDWERVRAPTTYQGRLLYRDRVVSPELYHNYGFRKQAEVEYQAPKFGSTPLILLEVFDMGTPENAFGIYSFNNYPQVKFEWVGSKAILSGGYLRFSKGKYFIQIEGYEFATGIREAMVLLAKNIAARIQEPASEPRMLTLLPSNKMSGSVKLFRSNWVLRQLYNTLPLNVPQLSDTALGVSARYRDNPDLKNWMEARIVFIIRFPDPSAAESAYTVYRDSVMEAALPLEVGTTGPILVNEFFAPKEN